MQFYNLLILYNFCNIRVIVGKSVSSFLGKNSSWNYSFCWLSIERVRWNLNLCRELCQDFWPLFSFKSFVVYQGSGKKKKSRFLFLLKRSSNVLLLLINDFMLFNQTTMSLTLVWKSVLSVEWFWISAVLSSKSIKSSWLEALFISSTKRIRSMGPSTEPCGTPNWIGFG